MVKDWRAIGSLSYFWDEAACHSSFVHSVSPTKWPRRCGHRTSKSSRHHRSERTLESGAMYPLGTINSGTEWVSSKKKDDVFLETDSSTEERASWSAATALGVRIAYGVPILVRVPVAPATNNFAVPKSATLACHPPSSSTLAGFRSRWITLPADPSPSCRCFTPSAIPWIICSLLCQFSNARSVGFPDDWNKKQYILMSTEQAGAVFRNQKAKCIWPDSVGLYRICMHPSSSCACTRTPEFVRRLPRSRQEAGPHFGAAAARTSPVFLLWNSSRLPLEDHWSVSASSRQLLSRIVRGGADVLWVACPAGEWIFTHRSYILLLPLFSSVISN